jgi:hypothetical protein
MDSTIVATLSRFCALANPNVKLGAAEKIRSSIKTLLVDGESLYS